MGKQLTLREKAERCTTLEQWQRKLARHGTLSGEPLLQLVHWLRSQRKNGWADAVWEESTARQAQGPSVMDARESLGLCGITDLPGLRLALRRESRKGVGARQGLLASLRSRIRTLEAVR